MDLAAPSSAPTSSFVLDDEQTDACRTHVAALLDSPTTLMPQADRETNVAAQPIYTAMEVAEHSNASVAPHNVAVQRAVQPASARAASSTPPDTTQTATVTDTRGAPRMTAQAILDTLGQQNGTQTGTTPSAAATGAPPTAATEGAERAAVNASQRLHPLASAEAAATTAGAGAAQNTAPTIVDVLGQLADNAAQIREAEEALQQLMGKQASLMLLERKLEQQRVISALMHPLGFHQGRPVAAVLLLRCAVCAVAWQSGSVPAASFLFCTAAVY